MTVGEESRTSGFLAVINNFTMVTHSYQCLLEKINKKTNFNHLLANKLENKLVNKLVANKLVNKFVYKLVNKYLFTSCW